MNIKRARHDITLYVHYQGYPALPGMTNGETG